jgi:hypothetical protein
MNRQLQKGISVSKPSSARRSLPRRTGAAGLAHSGAFDGIGALSLRLVGFAVLLAAAFLPFAASSASARPIHVSKFTFGSTGSGAGQLELAGAGQSSGLAVNEASGDVYVADSGNHRVDQFSSSGAFIRAFGWGVIDGSAELQVCTALTTCQAGLAGNEAGQLETPQHIAVDNSAGGSHGDLYVADTADHTVTKYSAVGALIESWANGGQLDGSTATDGPFTTLAGLTVDGAGNLDVLSASNFLFRFAEDGTFLDDFATANFIFPTGLALAPGGGYFKVQGGGEVEEIGAAGAAVGLVSPHNVGTENADVTGLAFDSATEALFAANENFFPGSGGSREPKVYEFAFNGAGEVIEESGACPVEPGTGCQPTETFGLGDLRSTAGIAVDAATGLLYVADPSQQLIRVFEPIAVPAVTTDAPSEVEAQSAILNGTVNPGGSGAATCAFAWGHTEALSEPPLPCGANVPDGSSAVPVTAQLTGLQPDTTYFYRLRATNANGTNPGSPAQTRSFTTPGPGLGASSVLHINSTSATLQVTINPHGAPTSFFIDYGTDIGYGSTAPAPPGTALGSGEGDVEATQLILGLASSTVYHYRIVTRSELEPGVFEEFDGPDSTFTTQGPGGSLTLPDSRQWQLVSPADKRGALIAPISEVGLVQASTDGRAISYLANAPIEADPQGTYPGGSQILSTRGSAGWDSENLSAPHDEETGITLGTKEWQFFTDDLSKSFLLPLGNFTPSISPEASESTTFLRTDYLNGDPSQLCRPATMHCYRPLVTGVPGLANVAAGTAFGEPSVCIKQSHCGPEFKDATPDGEHAVLASITTALTGTPVGGHESLYSWSAAAPPSQQLQLISLLPDGSVAKKPTLGYVNHNTRNALSLDGTRIVWGETTAESGGTVLTLYLRDTERGETIQLDKAEAGCEALGDCESGGGVFQLASKDGTRVLFTDSHPLTAGASAYQGSENGDLYECEIVKGAGGKDECRLTDLTPEAGGESADVQGLLPGASEDAQWVYFVANGVLSSQPDSEGEQARPGQCSFGNPLPAGAKCNLYVAHDGQVRLVSVLAGEDRHDWSTGLRGMPTRVSANGQWFEFMSQRSLTGYDNRDLATGKPTAEVYLYDAATDRLICASCDPTGARPRGVEYLKLEPGSGGLVGGPRDTWEHEALVAANVPGWTGINDTGLASLHQPAYLNDQGRLFFNTVTPLVPQDSNGTQDVYEYEPPGVGSCTSSSSTYGEKSEGCVSLISSGSSAQESAFLDASESGDDIFFLTSARLSGLDTDSSLDVYDAHVCTAAVPCLPEPSPPAPACTGDACQQPATAPNDATPGSLTFNGAGNVTECRKGQVKKAGKCVKKQQKKNKKKHHKKRKKVSTKGGNQKRANSKHGGHK